MKGCACRRNGSGRRHEQMVNSFFTRIDNRTNASGGGIFPASKVRSSMLSNAPRYFSYHIFHTVVKSPPKGLKPSIFEFKT